MEINLGLQMDEDTAKKIVSTQQTNNTTAITNGYSFNGKSYSYLTAKQARMTKADLRYNTEQDLGDLNLELSEAEMKLKKFLKLEHNTIDIINENMKLKELAAFIKASYEQDVEKVKEAAEQTRSQVTELQSKLDITAKDLEHRNAENNDLLLTQQKRQKEFEELYMLLEEREKEIESANKYSEALLNEKKKLLLVIEQKDRKIESLANNLYHKDQQLGQQLDDLNKIIRDLQDEKKDLLESLKNKNEQVTELTKKNADFAKELEALNADYKKSFNSARRIASVGKEDEFLVKQREYENLFDEHNNLKTSFEELTKECEDLKNQLKEKDNENVKNAKTEAYERELEQKNHRLEHYSKELDKLNEELDDKNDKIDELERQIDNLKRSLKKSEDDGAERSRKIFELDELLHKNGEQIKTNEETIKDINKQLDFKARENELQNNEINKLKERIKDLVEQIAQKDNDISESDKQKEAAENELEEFKRKFDEIEQENIELKVNKGGFNTNIVTQFDELKNTIAKKDAKANETELQMKKLSDLNQELQSENNKLKNTVEDLKRKLKEIESSLESKESENKELRDDNIALSTDLEEAIKDNTALQTKYKNLDEAYKILKADDKEKQKLAEYETQVNATMYKILKGVVRIKVKASEINEMLLETEAVDINVEEAAIQKLTEDQYSEVVLRIIGEIEGFLNENDDEIDRLKKVNQNLQQEKLKLTEKTQELEEQYADIRQRHDSKTDQIGKMTVKMFVIWAELERITHK